MFGKTVSAVAALGLAVAPVAAQAAVDVRAPASITEGESIGGGSEIVGLLAFLAALAAVVVVVSSDDDDDVSAPVSP